MQLTSWIPTLNRSPLLSEYCASYIEHAHISMSPQTIRGVYRPAIKSFQNIVGDLRLSEISEEKCGPWIVSIRDHMQPNSMRTRIVAMSTVFNYAIKTGRMSQNPFVNVKLPPPKFAGRILTDDELEKFLTAIDHDGVRSACRLSLYTGLRVGESMALDYAQILTDRLIVLGETSKSKVDRVLLLHPMAKELLGQGTGPVYNFCKRTLYRAIKAACDISEIGRIRFHDMRHNWATRFFEATKDPFALMQAGGWKNMASTLPYQHLTKTRMEMIYQVKYSFDA